MKLSRITNRKVWLQALGEVCEKAGWRVHAYVMMGNHYHLLLETPEANLVAGMKWFQGTVEKHALARWLRQRTAARREWVCERLCMGEVSAGDPSDAGV